MNELTSLLREVHRIHTQLSDLRDRQQRGPKQLKAREANVARLEAEHAQVVNEGKQARMLADQKNLNLKTGESKIRDLKSKLNASKTNREYQALKEQIAADEMANSVLSDEILEALEKAEEHKKHVAAALANIDQAKQELQKVRDAVAAEAALIAGDVARLEAELRPLEANLPEELRAQYDRMIRAKGSDGMSAVDGEACGGCYQTLTPNQYNSLKLNAVVFCGSCGRLLYLAETPRRGGT